MDRTMAIQLRSMAWSRLWCCSEHWRWHHPVLRTPGDRAARCLRSPPSGWMLLIAVETNSWVQQKSDGHMTDKDDGRSILLGNITRLAARITKPTIDLRKWIWLFTSHGWSSPLSQQSVLCCQSDGEILRNLLRATQSGRSLWFHYVPVIIDQP